MAICGHLAPNGEKSILYDELYNKYGEDKAHEIWELVRSEQFLRKHGDWVEEVRVGDKGPMVKRAEANELIGALTKRYQIHGLLAEMTNSTNLGEYWGNLKQVRINDTDSIQRRTIFHEYLHPFVQMLEGNRVSLFDKMYKEAVALNNKSQYYDVSMYDKDKRKSEIVTRYLDTISDSDMAEHKSLWQKFIDGVSGFLFNKSKEIVDTSERKFTAQDVQKLSKDTTVEQLYDVFRNYGITLGDDATTGREIVRQKGELRWVKQYLKNKYISDNEREQLNEYKTKLEKEIKLMLKGGYIPKDVHGEPTVEWVEKALELNNDAKKISTLNSMDAKQLYKEIGKLESPTDARGLAHEYFAGGGKISPETLYNEVITKRDARLVPDKKSTQAEIKDRDYIQKGAKSIQEVAHNIWDNLPEHLQDKITTEDIRGELIDVVQANNKRLDIAKKYAESYNKPAEPEAPIEFTFTGARDKSGRITEKNMLTQIQQLYKDAVENPDKTYILPYEFISEKAKLITGHTARELAKLLDALPIPSNVMLSPGMRSLIENSQKRITEAFKSDVPVEFINKDEPAVLESAAKLLVPITIDGKREGFFTPAQQKDIVDYVVTATERLYRKDPNMKDRTIMQVMKWIGDKARMLGQESEQGKYYNAINNARLQVADLALRQLDSLGLKIDAKTKSRILDAVERGTVPGLEAVQWQADIAAVDGIVDRIEDGGFMESVGRISRDWSDNSFELDPKDTASARIKMFMGTLFEMDKTVFKADPKGKQIETVDYKDAKQMAALAKELNRQSFWYKDQAHTDALVKYLTENHPRITKDTFIGTPKVSDYNDIFRKTLNILGNNKQNSTIEQFVNMLMAHPDPTLNQMAVELQKSDQSIKNEFLTVMMKQYQPFVTGLMNKTRDENGKDTYSLNPINTNRNSQLNTLIEHWKQQQKLSELTITSPSGEQVLDTERIKTRWMPILKQAQSITDWSDPNAKAWFKKNIGRILELSGISLTEPMLDYMMKYPRAWSSVSSVEALFGTNLAGEPTGPLSIFIMKSGGLMNINNSDNMVKLSQLNNPLETETGLNGVVTGIAKVYSKFDEIPYSSNHRNADGKNIWDWGMNTKLSHAFRSMTATNADFNLFAAKMDKVYIARNNWLIKTLRDNPSQVADMELAYMDMLKPEWGNKGTDRQAMSDREQMLMGLLLFQNNGNGFNRNSKVHYMSLTHGDKTVTPVFKNIPKLITGDYQKSPTTVIGTMSSALYNVFKGEYDRIINHESVQFNNRQYEAGKGLFYQIPEFNYDGMKELVKEGILTSEEFNLIWPAGMKKLTRSIDSDKELPVINKVLNHFMNKLVNNTLDKWRENGIVHKNGNIFDKNYVRRLLKENGIAEKTKEGRRIGEAKSEYVDAHGNVLSHQEVDNRIAKTAAKDYAINSFLFNTSLSQLFYGDPAESFKKSKEGTTDIDHVKSTMIEYTKRLAKDIAPRADLAWGEKRQYNIITLKDVETKAKYLADIEELKKYYADQTTTSTDAQEITTVQEKLDVLYAAGQLNSTLYTDMSNIIKNAKGGYYEFTNPDHKAVILQPEKPIYAGTSEPKNGAMLSDYIKSSAWALYPPFTKGRELDKLRRMMESSNIQRANFESARKLGNPLQPLEIFGSDGRFIEPDAKSLAKAIQPLSRDGFGIQQEVPYDEEKEAIKTLTQMNDNIVEDISHLSNFTLPGKENMNGVELKKFKEDVRKEMIKYNLDNLYKRLNFDENNTPDRETLFNIMEEEAKADTRNSYTLNELQSIILRDDKGHPLIPVTFNTAVDKFESLMMSMVNKVAEVKMPGKSYVQASATGIRLGKDSELKDMIPVNDWDGSPLKTLRIENGEIKPAQIIVPFNFFDAKGNKLKLEDFLVDGKLDMDRIPKELLNLVGGRIPNQKHSSMLPMEIVGFVPDNMGDIIFLPSEIVKQMGSDFDVDKLYTYKKPYTYDGQKFSTINNKNYAERFGTDDAEWQSLKVATEKLLKKQGDKPDDEGQYDRKVFNKALGEILKEKYPDGNVPKHRYEIGNSQRTLEHMQNDYFDVHWSILTHPDMITKVLRPLDKDDLKDEAAKLKDKSGGYYNFYDPMSQMEDFQRGKEAKRLVGVFAWASKFNARIQDKNLQYSQIEITPEGKVQEMPASITVVDEHTGARKELSMLSGNGISHYTPKDNDKTSKDTMRTKGDNLNIILSESVDNMKNRTLDNLNLNPVTAKAAQAFMQLQTTDDWAPNSKYWTRLLTQPVIKEFSKEMKQGNDTLSTQFDPQLYKTTYDKLLYKYTSLLEGEQNAALADDIVFDPHLLLHTEALEGNDYPLHQIAALKLFDKLYAIGDRMFQLEAQFNQDVSGAGRNLLGALNKEEQMDSLDSAPIMNASSIYNDTEVGATFDALNGTAIHVLSQVLPYAKMKPLFDDLNAALNKKGISIDNQRKFIKAFQSITFTTGDHWWKDAQAERVRLMFGPDSLARRLGAAQKTWGKDNPMLVRLEMQLADSKEKPEFITYRASGKAASTELQGMTTGWLDMLLSKDEVQRSMGEDLLRYAYLSGGVQDANSFVRFVPASFIANTDFAKMLKSTEDLIMNSEDTYSNDGLITQFIQHNPELAPQVGKDNFGPLLEGREYPEVFEAVKIGKDVKETGNKSMFNADGVVVPYLSYYSKGDGKWILYMKQESDTGTYFVRIDTLGNKYTDEYNGEAQGGQRSIFEENRSLAEQVPGLMNLDPLQSLRSIEFSPEKADSSNWYTRIGVQQGGEKEMQESLERVAANREVPEYLRSTADFLAKTKQGLENVQALTLTGYTNRHSLISFDNSLGTNAGRASLDGTIELNPNASGNAHNAAETFLHEMLHNRLQALIIATGNDARVFLGKDTPIVNHFNRLINQFKKDNPEVVKHFNELERIRYQAINELRNQWGEEKFKQIKNSVENGNAYSQDHLLYYGLHSVQELVAHVMTDKDNVIPFLNGIKDNKSKSLMERIWTKLMDIIAAFGRSMGVKVDTESLLHSAVYHTMRGLTDNIPPADLTQHLLTGETMKVESEAKANALKNLFEATYNREVEIMQNPFDYTLKISNQARKQVPGHRGKILDKLREQLSEVSDARNRISPENIVERSRYGIRAQEIKDQINAIHQSNNLDTIATIGKAQLQWIDNVLSSKTATVVDTNIALNMAAMWGNLIGILYGDLKSVGQVDSNFAEIQTRAQSQRIELINRKSIEVINNAFGGKLELKQSDIGEGLKDIDVLSANVLALTRAKPLLAQAIGHIGTKEANDRDEHIVRNTAKLRELKKAMETAGLTKDDILQLDDKGENWSLVDRYKPEWYNHVDGLRKTLDARIDGINVTEGLTPLARAERRKDAWSKYWREFNNTVDTVDIGSMFDIDGNKIADSKAEKDLIAKVGESHAKELIAKATQQFKEYLHERDTMKDYIESSIELTDEEAEGKTVQEANDLLEAKQKAEYDKWLTFNSPLELLSRLRKGKDVTFESHGDQWLVTLPRDIDKFADDKFKKIAADDRKLAAFNTYKEIHQEMVSYLPANIQAQIPDNHFPVVPKGGETWLASTIDKIRNWDTHALNSLTATDSEEASRIHPDKIPVMYINPRGITKELDNRSTDPIHVLEAFSMMALQHRYMGNVLDTINIAENVIKDINRRRIEGEDQGKPLTNLMNTLKYFKDVLVFRKPRELEAKINNTVYSINPVKQTKAVAEVKELTKRKTELDKERMDALLENDASKYESLNKEHDEIDAKLTKYQEEGRNIYGSKFADVLISINQQKALSYNPFSAVSNFSFAAVSLGIHGRAKVDYDMKHLRSAYNVMTNAMKKYWLFEKTGNATAQKVHELVKRSGIIGDVVDTDYGKSNLERENKSKLRSALEPFQWQRSGDYFTKGTLMVAMMKAKQIEVTQTGTGNKVTIPLWDAFNEKGEWDQSKYELDKTWYSDNISDQSNWSNYRDKMRKVSTIVFGNQDKNSPLMAKKNFLLRLAGQFRMSWFPEGIATRFKPEYYDVTLERAVKGRWRTYGDLGIFTSGMIICKQLLASLPGVKIDPFKGTTFKDGKSLSESAVDMENMRKNFSGLAWTVGITATILMLKASASGDDKKSKKARKRQLLINMLIRNQQDLMLYSSPSVFNTISGNFLPATQVLTDYWNAMVASGHYMTADKKHDRDAFTKWAKKIARAGLPHPVATQYNKIETMVTRDLDKLQR